MKTYIAVADGFAAFAQQDNIITFSKLFSVLQQNVSSFFANTRFLAGQGLSKEQQHAIYGLAALRGYKQEFANNWFKWIKEPADKRITHKHRPENILISAPLQSNDDLYISDLIIHDQNELMVDHQTGQHIQGMVPVEASRQIFIAVAEEFFLESGGGNYFVINSLGIEFQSFAFPLPAKVECRVVNKEIDKNNNMKFNFEIKIFQAEECAATVNAEFTVIKLSYINKREVALAEKKIASFLSL